MAEALSVTEFNNLVSRTVKNSMVLQNSIVVGEIVGLKKYPSGHIYFDLVDKNSLIKCTLFKYAASRLTFTPKDGMKVNVFGGASFYELKGTFSFNVQSMAESGKGDRQASLEELKKKLASEGLFDSARKRTIPKYPRVIGVVTSPAGAVIKDIIDTTAKRYPVDILLAPAMVQGDGASESIVHGIELLNKCAVDVIIVGRGGGSNDDLSAFNEEIVVRAVANSMIPTISAVGHATDQSLTDMVADRYAETPTAAAVIATPFKDEELKYVYNLSKRIGISLQSIGNRNRSRFNILDGKLSPNIFKTKSDVLHSKFNDVCNRFYGSILQIQTRHNNNQMAFERLDESMDNIMFNALNRKKHALELQSKLLSGLDPKGVLGRGYSFVTDADGRVLTSVSSISENDNISVTMRDGVVNAQVKEVSKK